MSRIPGVILSSDSVFNDRGTKRPVGYRPALGVQMAGAHCWAPYADVASALRSLALLGGLGENQGSREAARETLSCLFQHPAPFDAKVRLSAVAALEQPEVRATPVLYDQLRFEVAFGLTWADPRRYRYVPPSERLLLSTP